MNKNIIVVLTAIVVLLFSGIAICSALIPSNDSLSSNESQPSNIIATSSPITALYDPGPPPPPEGELIPPEPYPTFSPEPYPTWTPTPTPTSTSKPLEGQPSTIPQPSTGKTASGGDVSKSPASSGMTSISEEEVARIGGAPRKIKMISGSQLWVLYNGVWTKNSAAIYYGAWTDILLYNDQGQWISTEETYPSGWIDTRNWGYMNPGYTKFSFRGDAVGWHNVVAKGSVTGSSNVIWIYVWPTTPWPTPTPTWPPWPTPTPTWPPWPTPTPTWPPPTTFTVSAAWPSSYTYYIGSPVYIYFTVNKPCWARVTYIKQNSNIVWSGPTYVSAGTHTDAGTIGWPKGRRTVVVDAWTSSGEYDSKVTWYNVV